MENRINYSQPGLNVAAVSTKRKQAPYSKMIISHPNKSELIVCCGKNNWNRAKSSTWFIRTPKTVLPYKDNPEQYKWPAHNRIVMVFDFNPYPEGLVRLIELSKQLLIDGAIWILLISESFPMTKVRGKCA